MNYLYAIVDGAGRELSVGGIIALVSIAAVFTILAIIIFITWFINAGISSISSLRKKKKKNDVEPESNAEKVAVDVSDEDAVVAILVASIDYRNETHKNVKVLSVKEIK